MLAEMRRVSGKLDRAVLIAVALCFTLTVAPGLVGGDVFAAKVLGTPVTAGFLLCLILALALLWSVDRYDRRCVRSLEPLGPQARDAESTRAGHVRQAPHTLFSRPGDNQW
ncbi:hypothetical protein ACIQPR_47050 [Streptomyces sp. NPDC091280]|uniref:hypothetical protein n=1 Tax=Streptomyces sp. NPDC091280 TaxID=3365984 RepID=UPI0037F87830